MHTPSANNKAKALNKVTKHVVSEDIAINTIGALQAILPLGDRMFPSSWRNVVGVRILVKDCNHGKSKLNKNLWKPSSQPRYLCSCEQETTMIGQQGHASLLPMGQLGQIKLLRWKLVSFTMLVISKKSSVWRSLGPRRKRTCSLTLEIYTIVRVWKEHSKSWLMLYHRCSPVQLCKLEQ